MSEQTSLLRPLTVVAFGGNALLQARDLGTVEEQSRRARLAARWLSKACQAGHDLLIVHGNGPQVGQVMIQMQEGAPLVPPGTLDYAVAETQGSMGYLLDLALRNRFRIDKLDLDISTVVSLVVVDSEDPGFESPSKPVGPFFSRYQADQLERDLGWSLIEDAGKGWRKVVASPRPLRFIGTRTIRRLLAEQGVVIAGGGGGIPVVRSKSGRLEGVEAVIDKDRTAAMMGLELGARQLIIVTDVPEVYRNFGKPSQKALRAITVAEARRLLASGQFPPGSMEPKIEASADFAEGSGGRSIITDSENLPAALDGAAGTTIVPTPAEKRRILKGGPWRKET